MGDATSISWCDATWNPIRGCHRTAPEGSKQSGCGDPSGGGCYAERQAARFCGKGQPYEGLVTLTKNGPRWSGKTRFVHEHLMDPYRWLKPRRIFTDSMSDLFYDGVSDHVIDQVVAVMIICCDHETRGGHTFQTLTKRPERMLEYFTNPKTIERVASAAASLMDNSDAWYDGIVYRPGGLIDPKMWWGVSVENQAAADERVPKLLATPAAVRFISAEPLLGPVHLGDAKATHGRVLGPMGISWVIAGCESGPGARPCDVEWLRSIRDQCKDAGAAYFLKQAKPWDEGRHTVVAMGIGNGAGSRVKHGDVIELPYLDGVQHMAFPA